ncbi:MAG TPA: hypothetical protein VF549_07035 [Solirubrobacteraceae bacterium]
MNAVRLLVLTLILTFLPAAAAPAAGLDPGDCAWPAKADPDRVNVAFPDESAHYWITPFTVAPGTSMTITGRFPDARYLSFHLYEGSMPLDALADDELEPDAGGNPFRLAAARGDRGTYTVRVVAGKRPADAPANTLYAESLNGEPNVSGVIIYRLYLPEGDEYGGAGLPRVTYGDAAGGDATTAPLPSCQNPAPVKSGTVNDAVREVSVPAAPRESDAPPWGISKSRPETKSAGPVTYRTGGAFFPNFHNVYLSLLTRRDQGEVVAFRAKAPTYVQTRDAALMPRAQLRYFSICVNDFPTTRYVACLPDERIAVDADGFFTVVISDREHKPAKLGPSDNWLPSGPYADTFVLYRQMLPSADFLEAVDAAPSADEAPRTMGAYYPDTRICTAARFDADRCGLAVAQPRPATEPARTSIGEPVRPAAARKKAKPARRGRPSARRCRRARSVAQHARTRAARRLAGRTVRRCRAGRRGSRRAARRGRS